MTKHDEEGVRTRDSTVDIAVDGQHIAGTFIARKTTVPGVLFVHGWGGSQRQYITRAREIAQLGCVCLTFDLRGHGGTEEQRRRPFISRIPNKPCGSSLIIPLPRHPSFWTPAAD